VVAKGHADVMGWQSQRLIRGKTFVDVERLGLVCLWLIELILRVAPKSLPLRLGVKSRSLSCAATVAVTFSLPP